MAGPVSHPDLGQRPWALPWFLLQQAALIPYSSKAREASIKGGGGRGEPQWLQSIFSSPQLSLSTGSNSRRGPLLPAAAYPPGSPHRILFDKVSEALLPSS